MTRPSDSLKKQIDEAFDFRGHVTVRLKGGEVLEGYLFNRQYANPKLKEDNFIEMMLKSDGSNVRRPMSSIESVELTGEDCAAGNSYQDYLKKKAAGK